MSGATSSRSAPSPTTSGPSAFSVAARTRSTRRTSRGSAVIETEKLDDIRDVVIATAPDGTPIYVRQVAQVIVGHKPRQGIVGRGEEDDVIEGIVMMRKYEKSLPTAEAVAEKMAEIEHEKLLPKVMRIKVFNQRTDLVHVTTHNVLHNLLVGIGLVIAILFIFLGDLTSAGIVALVIPLALLYAITILYAQGKSANLLSIGAVDFGIIVDSSVIIVETIYRHITEHGADRSRPLIDRIADASREVERPLFFSTLIIVCAFLPLFTMSGPAGALFGPMAATYRLFHPRGPPFVGDAHPGPLLIPFPQQDGGERAPHRPGNEVGLRPRLGVTSSASAWAPCSSWAGSSPSPSHSCRDWGPSSCPSLRREISGFGP